MFRMIAAAFLLAALAACSSPAERSSPCACDWVPVNADPTERARV